MNWKSLSHVQLFVTLWTVHGILQARILEWVAFLFSRVSLQPRGWTQVYPHCSWILYLLDHQGSPRILESVAYPFSSRSSQLRNQTGVSGIGRWILYHLSSQGSSWNSPGQNTRVVSFSLLQGIFPIQGSNPGLLHCRWILYHLEPLFHTCTFIPQGLEGSPRSQRDRSLDSDSCHSMSVQSWVNDLASLRLFSHL